MQRPLRIALLTDFGDGPYVGQMQLLLSDLAPEVPVVPLINDLPPHRPELAAYLLPALARGMPTGTLYACVVDPGVGTDRDLLLVRAGDDWWLGPDNGLLIPLLHQHRVAQIHRVTWRPARMSASFHGRDLFMPLAARLVAGDWPDAEAIAAEPLVNNDWPAESWRVCYCDAFGNLMTGISADRIAPDATLRAGGRLLRGARTFSDVAPGEAFWYRNAFDLVELAVNQGRAEQVLGVGLGEPLTLVPSAPA